MPKGKDYLKSRYDEEYLLGFRQQRGETFNSWKSRINENDELIRGEWPVLQPDGSVIAAKPIVSNLADQMPRDVARLACEVRPSFRAPSIGDSEAAIDNSLLRSVIAEGYFEKNRFDVIRPQLVMDLVITGAAFMVCWTDSSSEYPRMMRVDPRAAYPDVYNGEALDLLTVQSMKIRVADRLWPDLSLLRQAKDMEDVASYIEVWDYYCADEVVKAVSLVKGDGEPLESGIYVVDRWIPKTDKPPIAFAQLPSPDGAFHGLIDQIGPSMLAKNQMASYIVDYSQQLVYAPFESKGVINAGDPPGPNTIYQHDPSATTETFIRRVSPAGSNPQLFGLLQYLDDEQRGQLAYPAARQGDVSQSIASASFVQATQGQLTSVVRDVQRLLSDLQEQAGSACFQLDQTFLDFQKPMIRSLGRKKMYSPGKDIGGVNGLTVNYGAGAGLDRLNTDVRLLQYYGAGLVSAESLLEETDFVMDAPGEIEKRQREEIARVILQRFSGDPNSSIDFIIRVYEIQRDEGVSLVEALARAKQELETTNAVPTPGTEGIAPETAAQPDQLALQKGAVPPPTPQPSFSSTPSEQIFINNR